jgi:hypothetical protein
VQCVHRCVDTDHAIPKYHVIVPITTALTLFCVLKCSLFTQHGTGSPCSPCPTQVCPGHVSDATRTASDCTHDQAPRPLLKDTDTDANAESRVITGHGESSTGRSDGIMCKVLPERMI